MVQYPSELPYRPCRVINTEPFGFSLGIYEIPCKTVEEALLEGRRQADSLKDFRENFIVVRATDDPVHDFVRVNDELVNAIKAEVSQ